MGSIMGLGAVAMMPRLTRHSVKTLLEAKRLPEILSETHMRHIGLSGAGQFLGDRRQCPCLLVRVGDRAGDGGAPSTGRGRGGQPKKSCDPARNVLV